MGTDGLHDFFSDTERLNSLLEICSNSDFAFCESAYQHTFLRADLSDALYESYLQPFS